MQIQGIMSPNLDNPVELRSDWPWKCNCAKFGDSFCTGQHTSCDITIKWGSCLELLKEKCYYGYNYNVVSIAIIQSYKNNYLTPQCHVPLWSLLLTLKPGVLLKTKRPLEAQWHFQRERFVFTNPRACMLFHWFYVTKIVIVDMVCGHIIQFHTVNFISGIYWPFFCIGFFCLALVICFLLLLVLLNLKLSGKQYGIIQWLLNG